MSLSKDIKNILDQVLDASINKKDLEVSAEKLKNSIQTRTRLGKSVEKTGQRLKSLKPLDPKYKKQRKQLRKKGILSSETSPAKSNLTKSGDMVDSIKVIKVTDNDFEISVTGRENKIKAENVQKDRPFMNIARFEIKEFVEDIINRARTKAKKL